MHEHTEQIQVLTVFGEDLTGRNHYRKISFLPRTNCRDLVTRRTCLAVIAHKAALSSTKALVSPRLSYLSPTPLDEVSAINRWFNAFFFFLFWVLHGVGLRPAWAAEG